MHRLYPHLRQPHRMGSVPTLLPYGNQVCPRLVMTYGSQTHGVCPHLIYPILGLWHIVDYTILYYHLLFLGRRGEFLHVSTSFCPPLSSVYGFRF